MGGCLSKGKPAGPARSISVLGSPYEDVRTHYKLDRELGRGQFAVTYLCTDISTGENYACKSISKRKHFSKNYSAEDIRREILVMKRLSGHRNIVQFKAAYEDKKFVHIVMEFCAGGELFDRIVARGHYSEKSAAVIFRSIVNIVQVCHSMGVIHGDLKLENLLLSDETEDAVLKLADFGTSFFFEQGKLYDEEVGTIYYMAPEVFLHKYGKEIDIWSAGVILYLSLSGGTPFWQETEKGIRLAILEGHIDFESQPWPSISNSAKDLVRKMLTQDPAKRITCAQILDHPWLKIDGEASEKPIDPALFLRMQEFRAMTKLKQSRF